MTLNLRRLVLVTFFATVPAAPAATVFLDFEALVDSTPVRMQFPSVVFSNATAISAGISLNEFEFPPHSGTNVIFDDGGPMSIVFNSLAIDFKGYFTYLAPLTLQAFDAGHNLVASASSLFSSNLAISGDPGSSPDELFQLSYAAGIAQISIGGDPFGGSFTLDDLTIVNAIPEPSGVLLLLTGGAAVFIAARKNRR